MCSKFSVHICIQNSPKRTKYRILGKVRGSASLVTRGLGWGGTWEPELSGRNFDEKPEAQMAAFIYVFT